MFFSPLLNVNIFTTSNNSWSCIHHPFYVKENSPPNPWRISAIFSRASPKQGSSGLLFCLNFSAYFNIYSVPESSRDTSHPGEAFQWQADLNRAWQGCDWIVRGTCRADGFSVIPTWGPTGTNWNAFVALSVGGGSLASYCLCCREIEGAFNQFWRRFGDYFMSQPRCCFAGCCE